MGYSLSPGPKAQMVVRPSTGVSSPITNVGHKGAVSSIDTSDNRGSRWGNDWCTVSRPTEASWSCLAVG